MSCISITVLKYVFVIYMGHRGLCLSPEFSLHCIALLYRKSSSSSSSYSFIYDVTERMP